MRILVGIFIPSLAIVVYLVGSNWVKHVSIAFVDNTRINHLIKFQLFGLLLSLTVIGLTCVINPKSSRLLRFGTVSAPAEPVKVLGIKPGDNWKKTGLSFLIGISVVTAIFMYLGLGKQVDLRQLPAFLFWILLFSLVNAFNEEIITRFAVVGLLDGVASPAFITWTAAFIFGGIHYFGTPGGVPGIFMAGFLGWILAKSVVETKGIGVAWGIHFVQDILIYGFIALSSWK